VSTDPLARRGPSRGLDGAGRVGDPLVLFVGDDWAEADHDIEIRDETGRRRVRRRLPEGIGGIALLHELIGHHAADSEDADDPAQVVIGIETDRGPWVQALLAAGYQVFAINPMSGSLPGTSCHLRCQERSRRREGAG
jgi:hypothetical protein